MILQDYKGIKSALQIKRSKKKRDGKIIVVPICPNLQEFPQIIHSLLLRIGFLVEAGNLGRNYRTLEFASGTGRRCENYIHNVSVIHLRHRNLVGALDVSSLHSDD